jgi:hypothetical protein
MQLSHRVRPGVALAQGLAHDFDSVYITQMPPVEIDD